MPSRFPGMDPYLERDEWMSFHAAFVVEIASQLAPRIKPKYVARPERRVYIESDKPDDYRVADVAVIDDVPTAAVSTSASASVATIEPMLVDLPVALEMHETFLNIRLTDSREVIIVVELLSPTNKRPGSTGRREYLVKRQAALKSSAHLVEIDLLRGGSRMPTLQTPPAGGYVAIVSRRERRPSAELFAWASSDPLPRIPIPLQTPDDDVPLDLQAAFTEVFDGLFYGESLDYERELDPPLGK